MKQKKWILLALAIGVATVITALVMQPDPHIVDKTEGIAQTAPPSQPAARDKAAWSIKTTNLAEKKWHSQYESVAPLMRIALPTRDEREQLHRKLSDPELIEGALSMLEMPISAYEVERMDSVLQGIDVLKRVAADPENPLRAKTVERLQNFVEKPMPGADIPLGVRKQIAGNKTEIAQILLVHSREELKDLANRVQDPQILRLLNRAVEEITVLQTNPS